MLLLPIALYLGLNFFIAYWASRKVKKTEDFVLAGRSLPFGLCMTTIFATWFGSETLIGATDEMCRHGWKGLIEEPLGAGFCLVLLALFFAKSLYRLGYTSLIELFETRFGAKTGLWVSAWMVPSYFGWIAAQFLALGLLFQLFIPFSLEICILAGAILVFTYTSLGGMWAIATTDLLQGLVIVLALICFLAWAWPEGAVVEVVRSSGLIQKSEPLDWKSASFILSGLLTLGLGSIPQQDVYQRLVSAKSEKVAQTSSIWAGLIYLLVSGMPILVMIFLNQGKPLHAWTGLLALIYKSAPYWIQVAFYGALLSSILSTASGALLAPATVLWESLLKKQTFIPLVWRLQEIWMIRLLLLLVSGSCVCLAMVNTSVFDLASDASGLSLVGLFVPLCIALFTKHKNAKPVFISMVVGTVVWFFGDYFMIEELVSPVAFLMAVGSYFLGYSCTRPL